MAPCFKCKERYLGCHAKCEKYQKFHDERVEIYKVRATGQRANEVLYETDKKIKRQMRGKG